MGIELSSSHIKTNNYMKMSLDITLEKFRWIFAVKQAKFSIHNNSYPVF